MKSTIVSIILLALISTAIKVNATPIADDNTTLTILSNKEPVLNCSGPASCDYNGICIDSNTCECNKEYTTHYKDGKENPYKACNYQQKNRVTAFCLQFFLCVFGSANWYLGNIGLAVGQLILYCGTSIVGCRPSKKYENVNSEDEPMSNKFYKLICLGCLAWWIAELVLIANGARKDGNGVSTFDNM